MLCFTFSFLIIVLDVVLHVFVFCFLGFFSVKVFVDFSAFVSTPFYLIPTIVELLVLKVVVVVVLFFFLETVFFFVLEAFHQ